MFTGALDWGDFEAAVVKACGFCPEVAGLVAGAGVGAAGAGVVAAGVPLGEVASKVISAVPMVTLSP